MLSKAEQERRSHDFKDGGNGDPSAKSPCDRLTCEQLLQQWPVEKVGGRAIVQPLDTEVGAAHHMCIHVHIKYLGLRTEWL